MAYFAEHIFAMEEFFKLFAELIFALHTLRTKFFRGNKNEG